MDVATSFLNGDMDEEGYMEDPEGVRAVDRNPTICKLIQFLHGLKQPHWRWNAKIASFRKTQGSPVLQETQVSI